MITSADDVSVNLNDAKDFLILDESKWLHSIDQYDIEYRSRITCLFEISISSYATDVQKKEAISLMEALQTQKNDFMTSALSNAIIEVQQTKKSVEEMQREMLNYEARTIVIYSVILAMLAFVFNSVSIIENAGDLEYSLLRMGLIYVIIASVFAILISFLSGSYGRIKWWERLLLLLGICVLCIFIICKII